MTKRFLLITLLFINTVNAQKNQQSLIIGKWVTEEDEKSKLLFDKSFVYQLYEGFATDTFRYYFIDSCRYSRVKGNFLKLVKLSDVSDASFSHKSDTLYFEIAGLSSKRLTLLDFNTTGQFWLLKRKK